ncbi:MAG: M23 family metallopeptidase [Bacteroidales bacterium]
MKYSSILVALIALLSVSEAKAEGELQETSPRLVLPLKTDIYLSGNFGELRSNHFHGGLDFRTEGRIGLPIYSVDEGYIARVSISHYGAGKALYVQHPGDLMSVYFHLDRFTPELTRIIEKKQYEQQMWGLDYTFAPGEIPVERDEQIAYSGNTGSSAGPHLHFEIRDTKNNLVINPKEFYSEHIKDTRKPIAQSITIYDLGREGFYDADTKRRHFSLSGSNGDYRLGGEIRAWGEIAMGVRAYDVKDEVHFKYGLRDVRLIVDDTLRYESRLDAFPAGESRLMNSLIDYPQWRANRQMIMKSLVDPGNRTPMFPSVHAKRGAITIDQERVYNGRYELVDYDGNMSIIRFYIRGVRRADLPVKVDPIIDDALRFKVDKDNHFARDNFRVTIPKGVLFEDMTLRYSQRDAEGISNSVSPIFRIHDENTPVIGWADIEIKLNHFSLIDPSKFYVGKVNGNRLSYLRSSFQRDGFVKGAFREFGEFALGVDTVMPSVTPRDEPRWSSHGVVSISASDAQSGLKFVRAFIDDKFVLLEPQKGSSIYRYRLNRRDIERGKLHKLRIVAEDMCGNESILEREFRW